MKNYNDKLILERMRKESKHTTLLTLAMVEVLSKKGFSHEKIK